ncbi:MAG: glycosyltransferase family 2 protein [Candidatus Omnitrophota bacterium]|nr:glycosyltransferase family 2 protein [Candidatus Omnitrophota bacterium]
MEHECDIILLSYESPELLKKCVSSVLEHTRVPSRLIIVDNASEHPEVRRYLHGVHGGGSITIEKVFSEENAGFAGGMNKGMRLSDAPFVCLLNNDCAVTGGWLEEMIAIARSRDDIGLVNPQSNTFGSCPDGKASIGDHAVLLSHKKGSYVETGHGIGFALLIKKEIIDHIGYLDEEYRGVCYEDTDFSVRARKAGFISVVAEGSYVFHVEQASRKTLKGVEEIYRRNRELFESRWGKLLRVFLLDSPAAGEGHMPGVYETLRGLAREMVIIELWITGERLAAEISAGFDRRRIVRHADIGINVFSGGFITAAIVWRVLTKKKKYDAVIAEEGLLSRILRFLRPLHGAEVLSLEGRMRLRARDGRLFDLGDPGAFAEYLRGKQGSGNR